MGWGVCGEGDALEQRDGLLRLLQRLVDAAELRGGKLAIAIDVKPRYFALEAEFGGGRRRHVEVLWSSRGTEEPFRVACQAMREGEVDVNVLQARKLLSTPPTVVRRMALDLFPVRRKHFNPTSAVRCLWLGDQRARACPARHENKVGWARAGRPGRTETGAIFFLLFGSWSVFPTVCVGLGGRVGGRAGAEGAMCGWVGERAGGTRTGCPPGTRRSMAWILEV